MQTPMKLPAAAHRHTSAENYIRAQQLAHIDGALIITIGERCLPFTSFEDAGMSYRRACDLTDSAPFYSLSRTGGICPEAYIVEAATGERVARCAPNGKVHAVGDDGTFYGIPLHHYQSSYDRAGGDYQSYEAALAEGCA